ncbi:MAG: transcriptional repressor [Nitrospiraceae bacterium]|nr:transcriptional repressor [Nitrospiraceae bacterium]
MNRMLKDIGLKATPQRMAILDFLKDNTSHPSAEEIYEAVAKRFPSISVATVYNTLAALKDKGSLLELTIDPAKKRYDPDTRPHHHLICLGCKRVSDIVYDFVLDLPGQVAGGYQITGNHVEFYGICPACGQNKDQKKTGQEG